MTSTAQAVDWIRVGQQGLGTRAPEWLAEHRAAALVAFEAKGFPTTRLEAWRFTNIAPIAGTAFELAAPEAEGADVLVAAHELRDSAATAVVVNGCFDEQLSAAALPLGVVVTGLASSFEDEDSTTPASVVALDAADMPFATLNAAFLEDGVHVRIPEGAVLTAPIHILLATIPEAVPVMAHPRILIEAGAQSQASVIVSFVGAADAVYLTNAVTQVRLDDGAVLELVIDQRESEKAFHVHHLHAHCAAASILHSRVGLARRPDRAQRPVGRARRRGRPRHDRRRLRRRRRAAGRQPHLHRPRAAALHQPRALQGHPGRHRQGGVQRPDPGAARRPEDRRQADQPGAAAVG